MQNQLNGRGWTRRDALRLSAIGAAAAAVGQTPSPAWAAPSAAAVAPLTLEQCLRLSPLDMVKKSAVVNNCYRFLLKCAADIRDEGIRKVVTQALRQPAPTVLKRFPTEASKEAVRQQLISEGLLKPEVTLVQLFPPAKSPDEAPQPFLSAPGSGFMSHHSYPGGNCLHVALNVHCVLGLITSYRETYGFTLDRDIILAAQLLHDMHKPWVFQWLPDGTCLTEYQVAGTGDHHILGVAESLYRGLPPEIVVSQCCTHDNPGADEAKIVAYLKAGAIIAGVNPVQARLIASDGKTVVLPRRIEAFVSHLGDHDWIAGSPVATWMIALLGEIAMADYGMSADDLKSPKFNALRNYVFSQSTMFGLHEKLVVGGRDSVRKVVHGLVVPA